MRAGSAKAGEAISLSFPPSSLSFLRKQESIFSFGILGILVRLALRQREKQSLLTSRTGVSPVYLIKKRK
jgi:hypothetical protein